MHARRMHRRAHKLRLTFGWTGDRMAEDARRVWDRGCPVCGQDIAAMPHRRFDLILRILDREGPPVYDTNTLWCCTHCRGWSEEAIHWRLAPLLFDLYRQSIV
jgi:hypothetical protein